jgi:hypothetical protein
MDSFKNRKSFAQDEWLKIKSPHRSSGRDKNGNKLVAHELMNYDDKAAQQRENECDRQRIDNAVQWSG